MGLHPDSISLHLDFGEHLESGLPDGNRGSPNLESSPSASPHSDCDIFLDRDVDDLSRDELIDLLHKLSERIIQWQENKDETGMTGVSKRNGRRASPLVSVGQTVCPKFLQGGWGVVNLDQSELRVKARVGVQVTLFVLWSGGALTLGWDHWEVV